MKKIIYKASLGLFILWLISFFLFSCWGMYITIFIDGITVKAITFWGLCLILSTIFVGVYIHYLLMSPEEREELAEERKEKVRDYTTSQILRRSIRTAIYWASIFFIIDWVNSRPEYHWAMYIFIGATGAFVQFIYYWTKKKSQQ